jgi:putative ABC transport system permease protein
MMERWLRAANPGNLKQAIHAINMTTNRLVAASFRHYWRSHLGLFFGVFLAAAVLSGSLLVGDSVRASLLRVAAERLGKVEAGLLGGDRWFTADLAREAHAVPMILLRGSVSEASGKARANAVQVLGVDEAFFKLSPGGNTQDQPKGSLILNEALARRLGVFVGDTVLVRLEKPSAISRDAPLSGEANQDITLRRKVTGVIGGEDFGNFQLQASQTAPDNVFLPLAELEEALGKKGRANALLSHDAMGELKSAKLEDFSLKLTRIAPPSESPLPADCHPSSEWELTTDRVFLDDAIAQRIFQAVPGSRGVLTYLVNGLSSARGRVPYSMVCGTDLESVWRPGIRPGQEPGPPLTDDSAVINQWLADDLQLAVGDRFEIRYFTVGLGRDLKEETAGFTVRGILPMTDPAVNPSWAPDFPGVTDAKNCRDWQPGIPMKLDAIRDKDEAYWKQYKTTPKAFISLSAGQRLWSNRFGHLTAIRFPDTGQDENKLREEIVGRLRLADIGLVPRDFRAEATAAAQGSVDFGGLFIGLSLFLIAASLVFSALLLIFTLETRASQIGLLFSLGWREKQVRRSILLEAGLVATLASVCGLAGGLVYTRGALAGLNGVWSGATVGMKLVSDFQPHTLAIAFASSLLVGLGTIWLASRRIFKARPKDLLAGDAWAARPGQEGASVGHSGRRDDRNVVVPRASVRHAILRALPVLFLVFALGLSFAGTRATDPEAVAGLFFGSGFCLLTAGLLFIRRWLRSRSGSERAAASIAQIGARNITRRPGRSLAVMGMMAGGIFLVVAVNAFRLGSETESARRDSGSGGFALIGESTLPVYEDLNSEAGREAFALDEKLIKEVKVVPFRVRDGDDASCLNLNKAQRPVLCAVNPAPLADRHAFSFAKGTWQELLRNIEPQGPAARAAGEKPDGSRFDAGSPMSEVLPGVADQATAMWGLGKGVGDTLAYTDASGREFQVKLVALLAGSVLQGKVIISERDFLSKFPDAAGYKFFLLDAPADKVAAVSAHLTKQLEIRGLAIESTAARLNAFNAVQNTYIGIFTVLGGLGVLLGTFGLGVLAMRNVLERRGEFGLMQAIGFKTGALRAMVLSEHAALLIGGLLLGLVSAGLAVWPNLKQGAGSLPLAFLLGLTLGILAFGLAACWLAARLALRGRLLDAVRRE